MMREMRVALKSEMFLFIFLTMSSKITAVTELIPDEIVLEIEYKMIIS